MVGCWFVFLKGDLSLLRHERKQHLYLLKAENHKEHQNTFNIVKFIIQIQYLFVTVDFIQHKKKQHPDKHYKRNKKSTGPLGALYTSAPPLRHDLLDGLQWKHRATLAVELQLAEAPAERSERLGEGKGSGRGKGRGEMCVSVIPLRGKRLHIRLFYINKFEVGCV